jgi:hypothetical protein
MEGLRTAFMAPAAGTILMVLGCASSIFAMNKVRYGVKDDNGKPLLTHPYTPWQVHKGHEEECDNAYRCFKMYENVKEWAFFSMPLMWIFSVFGGSLPYANGKPWLVEGAVVLSAAAWMLGNKWYIDGYIKSAKDRMPGFQLRTKVFRFWLVGSAAGILCSALERFGVSLPGK